MRHKNTESCPWMARTSKISENLIGLVILAFSLFLRHRVRKATDSDNGSLGQIGAFRIASLIVVAVVLGKSMIAFGAAQSAPDTDAKQFRLIEGRGVAVCDAYLDLLNQTPLQRTPFCGRPEKGPEPNFASLDRHYLDADEIEPLFSLVWEFMRFNDQHHKERYSVAGFGGKPSWSSSPVTHFVSGKQAAFFRLA